MTQEQLLQGTERNLLLRPFQWLGWARGWLHEKPFQDYLNEQEDRYDLFDTTNPITVIQDGTEQTHEPDRRYRTIISLTDQRLLIVVGKRSGNRVISISWDEVGSFGLVPQDLPTQFSDSTEPAPPAVWVQFEFTTDELVAKFKSDKKYDMNTVIDDLAPFLEEQTSVEQWEAREQWLTVQENYREAKKAYKRKERERARIAAQSKGGSVTEDVVRKTGNQLQDGEQPHFYLTGGAHVHEIKNQGSRGPQDENTLHWALFTNERVIIHYESDVWRIEYPDITDIRVGEYETIQEVTRKVQGEYQTVEKPITKAYLQIETLVGIHTLDVENLHQQELTELVHYVRTSRSTDR